MSALATLGATAVCAARPPVVPQPQTASQAQATASAAAAPAGTGVLVVRATGFDDARGHAVAKLYRPGENVLKPDSYRRATAAIQSGSAHLAFGDLPDATYALVVFHDSNNNGRIDHNALSLPDEQLGFSNGFRLGVFSGLPSFEKLQFRFVHAPGPAPVTLDIEVR